MKRIEYEVNEKTYSVGIVSFDAGEQPSRDSPGEGASVEFDDVVDVEDDAGRRTAPFAEFLADYCGYHGASRDDLEEDAIEQIIESLHSDYEDSIMNFTEDERLT